MRALTATMKLEPDMERAAISGLGLNHGSVVVDLGAGTGQFSLAVAAACARVVAVDVSPVMLHRLRDKVDADDRVESWCATGGADVEGEWLRTELEEHVRDEYSTFSWLLEPMMSRCGFSIETAEYSPDGFSAKYIARAV